METVKNYIRELKESIDCLDQKRIEDITEILLKGYRDGKNIFIVGNGGSAATASHFACDLSKGTLTSHNDINKKRFKVHSLTDNVAVMTAYGNDIDYESIFSQQLINLAQPEDILIAITASGNSANIIKAVEVADHKKMHTIGFLGFDGGEVSKIVNNKIIINSRNYGVIEDIHLILEHMICQDLKEKINNNIFERVL